MARPLPCHPGRFIRSDVRHKAIVRRARVKRHSGSVTNRKFVPKLAPVAAARLRGGTRPEKGLRRRRKDFAAIPCADRPYWDSVWPCIVELPPAQTPGRPNQREESDVRPDPRLTDQ